MSRDRIVKLNLTANLGLPFTGVFRNQMDPYFVGAYLHDDRMDREQSEFINNHVFVLMRYQSTSHFQKVEKYLESLNNYRASYDVFNGNFVMFVFEVLDTYKRDFNRFVTGKYSKITKKGKALITHNVNPKGIALKIINKDDSLKRKTEEKIGQSIGDQEVWSVPDPLKEHFSEEVLKSIIHDFKMKGHALA